MPASYPADLCGHLDYCVAAIPVFAWHLDITLYAAHPCSHDTCCSEAKDLEGKTAEVERSKVTAQLKILVRPWPSAGMTGRLQQWN